MRKVTLQEGSQGYRVIIGDPDARDNSNQKMIITESEAALLLMKLKMALNREG